MDFQYSASGDGLFPEEQQQAQSYDGNTGNQDNTNLLLLGTPFRREPTRSNTSSTAFTSSTLSTLAPPCPQAPFPLGSPPSFGGGDAATGLQMQLQHQRQQQMPGYADAATSQVHPRHDPTSPLYDPARTYLYFFGVSTPAPARLREFGHWAAAAFGSAPWHARPCARCLVFLRPGACCLPSGSGGGGGGGHHHHPRLLPSPAPGGGGGGESGAAGMGMSINMMDMSNNSNDHHPATANAAAAAGSTGGNMCGCCAEIVHSSAGAMEDEAIAAFFGGVSCAPAGESDVVGSRLTACLFLFGTVITGPGRIDMARWGELQQTAALAAPPPTGVPGLNFLSTAFDDGSGGGGGSAGGSSSSVGNASSMNVDSWAAPPPPLQADMDMNMGVNMDTNFDMSMSMDTNLDMGMNMDMGGGEEWCPDHGAASPFPAATDAFDGAPGNGNGNGSGSWGEAAPTTGAINDDSTFTAYQEHSSSSSSQDIIGNGILDAGPGHGVQQQQQSAPAPVPLDEQYQLQLDRIYRGHQALLGQGQGQGAVSPWMDAAGLGESFLSARMAAASPQQQPQSQGMMLLDQNQLEQQEHGQEQQHQHAQEDFLFEPLQLTPTPAPQHAAPTPAALSEQQEEDQQQQAPTPATAFPPFSTPAAADSPETLGRSPLMPVTWPSPSPWTWPSPSPAPAPRDGSSSSSYYAANAAEFLSPSAFSSSDAPGDSAGYYDDNSNTNNYSNGSGSGSGSGGDNEQPGGAAFAGDAWVVSLPSRPGGSFSQESQAQSSSTATTPRAHGPAETPSNINHVLDYMTKLEQS